MIEPICVHCEGEFAPDERAWLREDDTLVCDLCHDDALAEDIFDRYDHGSPYYVSFLTNEVDGSRVVRYVPTSFRDEGAIPS